MRREHRVHFGAQLWLVLAGLGEKRLACVGLARDGGLKNRHRLAVALGNHGSLGRGTVVTMKSMAILR